MSTLRLLSLVLLAAACAANPHPSDDSAREVSLASAIPAVDSIVESSIGKLTPGAMLLISRDGKVIHQKAFGYAQLNDFDLKRLAAPRPMTVNTMFDMASVTKVMATTFAVMM